LPWRERERERACVNVLAAPPVPLVPLHL